MLLLPFRMPPYNRTQWASKKLKEEWEPKIREMQKIPHELLKIAVFKGILPGAVIQVPEATMDEFKKELSEHAAYFIPLRKRENFWVGALSLDMARSYELIRIMADKSDGRERRDELVGTPKCCSHFNIETSKQGYVDPTWQYASAGNESIKNHKDTGEIKRIRIRREANQYSTPYLRFTGLYVLPYMPCSPDCEESNKLANDIVQAGREAGVEGLEEFLLLLEMPVEWNALKGIAYLSSPIFKIEHATVTCYPNYIVQKEGTFYPEGAPRGLKFPYNELPPGHKGARRT